MRQTALVPAVLLALATPALAQKGFDRGEFGGGPRIYWYDSVEAVSGGGDSMQERIARKFLRGMDNAEKKYMFVYIRPGSEEKEPNEFNNNDIVLASRQEWAFVRMDVNKDNAHQRAWGVKGAPLLLGCDMHGNDFVRAGGVTIDAVRSILKGTPDAVAKYEQKIRNDYAKAVELAKSDEGRAVKALVDLVAAGKPGYKEVTEAQARLNEIAESAFRRVEVAESVSLESGLEQLEELVKVFRSTAPGIQAEIRIARLERARDNPAAAIARLQKVLKADPRLFKKELEEAAALLQEISKDGQARIESTLATDRARAKDVLKKLARDYAGTEAGKQAGDEARKLE